MGRYTRTHPPTHKHTDTHIHCIHTRSHTHTCTSTYAYTLTLLGPLAQIATTGKTATDTLVLVRKRQHHFVLQTAVHKQTTNKTCYGKWKIWCKYNMTVVFSKLADIKTNT